MIGISPLGVNLLPPLLSLMVTTRWQLSRFPCLVMSVEDLRLLALSFVLVCLQNRTGANEKPVRADPSNGLRCYLNTQQEKFCLAGSARTGEEYRK
jgi:hypothetical protein